MVLNILAVGPVSIFGEDGRKSQDDTANNLYTLVLCFNCLDGGGVRRCTSKVVHASQQVDQVRLEASEEAHPFAASYCLHRYTKITSYFA